jgi:uncharacterized membrane protein YphA (DoxX/SURF4 family)
MLNPFPQLLVLSFFAPTLLRAAAALVFFYLALSHFKNRAAIAGTRWPVWGTGAWIPWVATVADSVVGAGLLAGYWTQVAALLGALLGLKYAFWAGRYETYFVLSRTAALLLAVICLSLLLTGAGALAFDVPL